jgi:hypothetical protein
LGQSVTPPSAADPDDPDAPDDPEPPDEPPELPELPAPELDVDPEPLHAPAAHVCPNVVQSTHTPPAIPHAVSTPPV